MMTGVKLDEKTQVRDLKVAERSENSIVEAELIKIGLKDPEIISKFFRKSAINTILTIYFYNNVINSESELLKIIGKTPSTRPYINSVIKDLKDLGLLRSHRNGKKKRIWITEDGEEVCFHLLEILKYLSKSRIGLTDRKI